MKLAFRMVQSIDFSQWLKDPGYEDDTMHRVQALLDMEGPGGMGTLTLDDIKKGPVHRAPRIVLLGVEKVGKSTFGADADNPIFIPIEGEEGIDDFDVSSTPVVQTYQDMLDAIEFLINVEHGHQTVVIDTSSTLDPIVQAEAVRRENVKDSKDLGGGFGRQYDTILLLWKELQAGLDFVRNKKNMTLIMLGHVKVGSFDDPLVDSYSRYQWDVAKKVDAQLSRWADLILFANKPVITKQEDVGFNKVKTRGLSSGGNVLYTKGMPGHPGGGRGIYGELPDKMEFTWAAFSQAVENAKKARDF